MWRWGEPDDGSEQHREKRGIPGVIETIGTAYSQLVARPYIILGPILLDLYLWLGLRVTAGPLVREAAQKVDSLAYGGDTAADVLKGREGFNLFDLTSMQVLPTFRVPTVMPGLAGDSPVRLGSWQPEVTSLSWWLLAAMVPVLGAAGYLIGAEFFLWLADVVRGRSHRVDLRRTVRTGWELFAWLVIGAGLLLLVAGPLLLAQLVLIEFGSGASPFVYLIASIPAGVGFLLFFFSAYAIVVDQITAMEAYRASYQVVKRYLWQSIGFIAIYVVIISGFPIFWGLMLTEPAGTLLAIIGNAFVASGMIAAAMLYYQDRAPLANAVTTSS